MMSEVEQLKRRRKQAEVGRGVVGGSSALFVLFRHLSPKYLHNSDSCLALKDYSDFLSLVHDTWRSVDITCACSPHLHIYM